MKIAVCITFHFVEERILYLKEVCKSLAEFSQEISLTIITNTSNESQIVKIKKVIDRRITELDFFIPNGLGHPYLLPWSHLNVFRKQIKDSIFTHFLYLEDDIKIEKKNITYWIETRKILKTYGFYPSFFRIEQNEIDKNWYSTDVIKPMSIYDCPQLNIDNTHSYINIVYPYQGMYFLDRELMEEHLEGLSSNPDYEHISNKSIFNIPQPRIREKASLALTYVNIPFGFRSRNLLPYDNFTLQIDPKCMIHHLPNNYTNDPNSIIGKIKINNVLLPKSINLYIKKKIKIILSFSFNRFFKFLS